MTDSNDEGGRRPRRPDERAFRERDGADRGRPRPPARGDKPPARFDAKRPRPGSQPLKRVIRPPRVAEGEAAAEAPPVEDRIAKVIARAGIASRRDAEAMVAEGRVAVNGETLTSPALNVGAADKVTVDGEPLPLRERTRLWLFHKPRGLVTTARDPEGRQTVFDALPEDMPRVVSIGRLDINTEGLLLLTNDGGLAKVVAHPDTGWTRRYRVRAHGELTQTDLDRLRNGVTIDGMEYGSVDATLDRVQGDNLWITLALREGKNREVKRILEHLGLQVNRLIRLSFGPFQLGELEQGLVEEVRTRVLKDQLGATLAAEAEVDFESPVREPIAPFGSPKRTAGSEERIPRPRSARPEREERPGYGDSRGGERHGGERARGTGRPAHAGGGSRFGEDDKRPASGPREPRRAVWRDGAEESAERPRKPFGRREDPKAERAASADRPRERVGAIRSGEGRKVLVERVVAKPAPAESRHERPRHDRDDARSSADRAPRPERPARGGRPDRTGYAGPGGDRGPRRPDGERPKRAFSDRAGGDRPAGKFGGDRAGGDRSGGDRPGGDRSSGKFGGDRTGNPRAGGKPGRPFAGAAPRPGGGARFAGKPGGRPGSGDRAGDRPGGGGPKGRGR